MKCNDRIYKYLFYILLGIVSILIVPIIIGLYGKDIFNFKISEILSYYGVLISGVITLIGLKITIENGNKTVVEQFNLQNYQRHLERYENDIERIVLAILNYNWDIANILEEYCDGDEVVELNILLKIILRCRYKIREINNKIVKESKKIFMYKNILEKVFSKEKIIYLQNIIDSLELIQENIKNISNEFNTLEIQCREFIEKSNQKIFLENGSLINYLNIMLSNWYNAKNRCLESSILVNNAASFKYIRDNYNSFIDSLNNFPTE